MNIEYIKKQNYGRDVLYIVNNEIAKTISNLTGKKTIDSNDILNFKKLGVDFVQVMY